MDITAPIYPQLTWSPLALPASIRLGVIGRGVVSMFPRAGIRCWLMFRVSFTPPPIHFSSRMVQTQTALLNSLLALHQARSLFPLPPLQRSSRHPRVIPTLVLSQGVSLAVLPSSQLSSSPFSICASAGGMRAPVAAAAGGGPSCRLENCDAAVTRHLRYSRLNHVSEPTRRSSDQTRRLARSGTKRSSLLPSPRSSLNPLTLHLGAARRRQTVVTVALLQTQKHTFAAPPIIPLRTKRSSWSARTRPAVLGASPRHATRAMRRL